MGKLNHQELNGVLNEMKLKFQLEEAELTAKAIFEDLDDRGLMRDGELARLTEDNVAVWGDELVESVSGSIGVLVNSAADTAANEFEDLSSEDAAEYVAAFIDEMVNEGDLPPLPSEGDAEGEAQWVAAAMEIDFVESFLDWMTEDGE
jgi:hypothetical protein